MTTQTPPAAFTKVQAHSTKFSDVDATVGARRQGTGAAVYIKVKGARGGERQEQVTLSNAQREQLIEALGGTP